MEKEISLIFEKNSALNNLKKFDEIKELLEKHGVYLDVDYDFTEDKAKFVLEVDENKVKRSAGRNRKATKTKNSILVKLSDIEKMQETMTDEEIISQMNISRATFYRRLKRAKETRKMIDDNYDPIF